MMLVFCFFVVVFFLLNQDTDERNYKLRLAEFLLTFHSSSLEVLEDSKQIQFLQIKLNMVDLSAVCHNSSSLVCITVKSVF